MQNRTRIDISSYELSVFRELGEAGSLSRAAERLGLSQSGLSRLVQRLERQIGSPLLLRTKQGIKLTKAGERFLQESGTVLREIESFLDRVRRQNTDLEGSYSLGAHPQVAAVCLPKLLRKLLHENPGLELKLIHDLSRRIVERIVSLRIDFGIVVDPTRHPDLSIVPLYRDPMGFWCKPGVPRAEGLVIGDFNLKQTEELLVVGYRRGRLRQAKVLHSSDLTVVREMVAEGLGVGILTESVARRGAETLHFLGDWPVWTETVSLVYRRDFQRTRAAVLIRDTIVSLLKRS